MIRDDELIKKQSKYRILVSTSKFAPVIKTSSRGVNPKFWIHIERPPQKGEAPITTKLKGKDFLVKSNRSIYDGIGEVLYYLVCDQVGYGHRCVHVRQATIVRPEKDTKKYPDGFSYDDGVIAPSYIKRSYGDNPRVISGKSFINERADYIFENRYGEQVSRAHTLANYLEALNFYRESKYFGEDVEIFNNIERRLKFMCLVDYLTCQSDRHWENVEFLLVNEIVNPNEKDPEKFVYKKVLKLAHYYDNSHVFNLHTKGRTLTLGEMLQNIYKLKNPAVVQEKLDRSMEYFRPSCEVVPMFGIVTPTYESTFKDFGEGRQECISLSKDKEKLNIFLQELAQLLISDPQMMADYQKLKQINYEELLRENFDQAEIPESMITAIKFISDARVTMLDQALEQCINQDREDSEDDELHLDLGDGMVDLEHAGSSELDRACSDLEMFMNGIDISEEDAGEDTGEEGKKKDKPKTQDDGIGGQ